MLIVLLLLFHYNPKQESVQKEKYGSTKPFFKKGKRAVHNSRIPQPAWLFPRKQKTRAYNIPRFLSHILKFISDEMLHEALR
jgi:hypothetical protein